MKRFYNNNNNIYIIILILEMIIIIKLIILLNIKYLYLKRKKKTIFNKNIFYIIFINNSFYKKINFIKKYLLKVIFISNFIFFYNINLNTVYI